MTCFQIGDVVLHPKFGLGEVCNPERVEDGSEVIDVDFGGEIKLLSIQYAQLEKVTNQFPEQLNQQFQSWLKGVFFTESSNQRHFKSGRWEPFFEDMFFFDAKKIRELLTKFLPEAKLFSGRYNFHTALSALVNHAPISYQLNSPNHDMGLSLVLDSKAEGNKLHTVFPFCAGGTVFELNLENVLVFDNGLEALVTGDWRGIEICFYDTKFIHHRAFYTGSEAYDFVLTGIAYSAESVNSRSAMFSRIEAWGSDDYQFGGKIKALEPFDDFLGQTGWIATVTVMKTLDDDLDQDLKIVITKRAWQGEQPPELEEYIEGELWLQGYLWNVTNRQLF